MVTDRWMGYTVRHSQALLQGAISFFVVEDELSIRRTSGGGGGQGEENYIYFYSFNQAVSYTVEEKT